MVDVEPAKFAQAEASRDLVRLPDTACDSPFHGFVGPSREKGGVDEKVPNKPQSDDVFSSCVLLSRGLQSSESLDGGFCRLPFPVR